MELSYRQAGPEDLTVLTETRIEVLRAANRLDETADLSEVRRQTQNYYKEAFRNQSHAAYLVYDGDRFVSAGGVSFYRVMPTVHNPTGYKAYIMNMYTSPEYRRNGIAYETLRLLVGAACQRGVSHITLEATDMGRPLYEKYGFVKMEDEMRLPEGRTGGRI